MDKLFLLDPDFIDNQNNATVKHYYCPKCEFVDLVIKCYPQLQKKLDIHYIQHKASNTIMHDLIGDANQTFPALVIARKEDDNIDTSYFNVYNDHLFINSAGLIAKYFSDKYGIGLLHH